MTCIRSSGRQEKETRIFRLRAVILLRRTEFTTLCRPDLKDVLPIILRFHSWKMSDAEGNDRPLLPSGAFLNEKPLFGKGCLSKTPFRYFKSLHHQRFRSIREQDDRGGV